jgi:hypothetical protein
MRASLARGLGVLVVCMTASMGSARAETGDASLKAARASWDKGDFGAAEPQFKEAIEKGGLSPADVLDAYVRLASVRLILGKKDAALNAFRAAAVIDPHFTVPPEAGKKANQLAVQARKDTAKYGALVLRATVPPSVAASTPVKVEASVDDAHLPLVQKIGVTSKDSQGKEYAHTEPSSAKVTFEIPASAVSAGGTLVVRVDALDAHDNRIASVEDKVKIEGDATADAAVAATVPGKIPEDPPPIAEKKARSGGGFFSSPWPYILGGVLLAAGGAVVYFGTRPTGDVTVGSPSVRNQ